MGDETAPQGCRVCRNVKLHIDLFCYLTTQAIGLSTLPSIKEVNPLLKSSQSALILIMKLI